MAWVYYAHIAGITALGWLEKQCAMGFPVIHSVSTKLPKIMKYFAATGNAKEAIVKNLDELDAVAAEIAHAATVTYTIQPGDTLSQLAITFSTSVAAIAAANGVGDVNKIRAGTTLTMPG